MQLDLTEIPIFVLLEGFLYKATCFYKPLVPLAIALFTGPDADEVTVYAVQHVQVREISRKCVQQMVAATGPNIWTVHRTSEVHLT